MTSRSTTRRLAATTDGVRLTKPQQWGLILIREMRGREVNENTARALIVRGLAWDASGNGTVRRITPAGLAWLRGKGLVP